MIAPTKNHRVFDVIKAVEASTGTKLTIPLWTDTAHRQNSDLATWLESLIYWNEDHCDFPEVAMNWVGQNDPQ